MGGTADTKVTYFAAGAIAAGLIAGALWTLTGAEEEERPPIIVKGGSLIFESGDKNKPKEPKGKKWLYVDSDDWQPDHNNGISVSDLTVAIRGGNQGSCPALDRVSGDPANGESPVITVVYKVGQTESSFTITTRKKGNKWIPTIHGAGGNQEGAATDYPQLVYGTHNQGGISRVQFQGQNANVNCDGPITSLKVWQDR